MSEPQTVINLSASNLYQSLDKLSSRYFEKIDEVAKTGSPMTFINHDVRELAELYDKHRDAVMKVLWIHGAYVGGVMILCERLEKAFIGATGKNLTGEQYEVLKNVVSALQTMNKIHTNLPNGAFDLREIYKYLNI